MDKTILWALLNTQSRISCGWRWLVIDESYVLGGEFVVYEKRPHERNLREIYRGISETEAIKILID
jgi:hypothetical protein